MPRLGSHNSELGCDRQTEKEREIISLVVNLKGWFLNTFIYFMFSPLESLTKSYFTLHTTGSGHRREEKT